MNPSCRIVSWRIGGGVRFIFPLWLAVFLVVNANPTFAGPEDFKPIVKTWGPSVGTVLVNLGEGRQSIGSGYLITQNGRFITNAHVIQNAKSVYVRRPGA
jgi:S1-C subfamily serine protease